MNKKLRLINIETVEISDPISGHVLWAAMCIHHGNDRQNSITWLQSYHYVVLIQAHFTTFPRDRFNRDMFRGPLPRCHKLLLSLWPMQEQVSESNQGQLCQSHDVVVIVTSGRDESHPRICFLWLNIALVICAVAFWIFYFWSCLKGVSCYHPCTVSNVGLENPNSYIYSMNYLCVNP